LYGVSAVGTLVYAAGSIMDLKKAYQTWTGRKQTPFDAFIALNTQVLLQPQENLPYLWLGAFITLAILIYLLLH
jgi:hypothetical protein